MDFDLADFLPYRLSVLSERVSRDFATIYRTRFGLSRAEWRVLAHLSQAEAVSVRDIHEKAELEKSKVSRAATRLEMNGYITKTVNPQDRRLVSLALTPKGQTLMAEMVPLAHAYQYAVIERMGPHAADFLAAVQTLLREFDPEAGVSDSADDPKAAAREQAQEPGQ